MAKWLDKYEQGGLVLKKKTKDNFSLKGNANDSKVSVGPDFVGAGYAASNWKSPAWGGQFQDGGILGKTFLQPNNPKLPIGWNPIEKGYSTEYSTTIGKDGEYYLVPGFKHGKLVSDPEKEFHSTGELLGGPFKTIKSANDFANRRHKYVEKGQPLPSPMKTYDEFQMGGSMPGAVGFMYARTQNPAPANGKYTKKTLASAQNGQEMKYWQDGLDFKPKSISKKGKKIIKDDRGQWAHPGEITEINSPDITMQGVDYPVLGISDTGHTQMMQPGQDYKFDGKKVTEYPIAQDGDWLKKYAMQPKIQDNTRNKQFEESAKNTINQYRRAIDPENQPHISKWTPKPGEIKRLEEQDRQRREENSGFLNRLAANPHVAKLQENVVLPMFDLYTLGEGAVAAKTIAKPALEQAGKYLTEKAALKSATASATPSNIFTDIYNASKSYLNEKAGEKLAGAENRAAIAEGNKWSQDWVSHPETAKKLRRQIIDQKIFGNQKPEIFDRINSPETSEAYHFLTNYKPEAAEYPLDQQKKDLINILKGNNNQVGDMIHGDNLGVSYRHGFSPMQDMDIYIPGRRRSGPGTWISRTPQMDQAARKSVTIHENAHDWLRADALERLGYKDEIQSHLTQDAMDDLDKFVESGYDTKKHYTGYLANPTEVHARIMEARHHFGLTPTDKVTPEMAEAMLEVIRQGKVPTVSKKFADIFSSPRGVSELFNRLPAVAPVAVGVGAAATLPKKQKDGGWLNKYK